jgi:hypothetical protein
MAEASRFRTNSDRLEVRNSIPYRESTVAQGLIGGTTILGNFRIHELLDLA